MASTRRPLVKFATAAWLVAAALPLGAADFGAFLARFKEIVPPAALARVAERREELGSIPIEEFEAYVLVPAHALAAARPGLRSLDEWPAFIREFRRFQGYQSVDGAFGIGLRPSARLNVGGYHLVAMDCSAGSSGTEGGEFRSSSYLLSFSQSGNLIDGFQFERGRQYPPRVASGGALSLGSASLAFDGRGRIAAFDTYGVYDKDHDYIAGEAWTWEVGLSSDGRFTEPPKKRLFLLSRIYAERGDPPGRLYVYETEARSPGAPVYLAWDGIGGREVLWALAEAGVSTDGVVRALDASGRGLSVDFSQDRTGASLSDPAGTAHELGIEYGPGEVGEPTRLQGVLPSGDRYDQSSTSWTYFFAEASLPSAPKGEMVLFPGRSFVVGTNGSGPEGSDDDLIAHGTSSERREYGMGAVKALFEARSLYDFQAGRIEAGVLARDLKLTQTLPAGTRIEIGDLRIGAVRWRAELSKETAIPLLDYVVMAPAGSMLELNDGAYLASVAFSTPVPLRIGSAVASIYGLDYKSKAEVRLAAPFAAAIGGRKVAFADSLIVDGAGSIQSGRLAADAEFAVGGRNLPFRGGYDPERPEAGIVSFYPDGKLLSGSLAKRAQIQTAKASLNLVEGDALTFDKDGGVASLAPIAMTSLTIGARKAAFRSSSIDFEADGSVARRSLPEELRSAAGSALVSALGATCTDTRVRVRAGPGLHASILGFLDRGDRVIVLDRNTRSKEETEGDGYYWYRVRRVQDGLTGWSYGQYLEVEH